MVDTFDLDTTSRLCVELVVEDGRALARIFLPSHAGQLAGTPAEMLRLLANAAADITAELGEHEFDQIGPAGGPSLTSELV
jgi:hypothetical protein